MLSKVASVVDDQPVPYLQNIDGSADPLLFEIPVAGKPQVLKPGVMFCLRRYCSLMHQLAKAGWVSHVKSNNFNAKSIGTLDDLESSCLELSDSLCRWLLLSLGLCNEILASTVTAIYGAINPR